MRSGEGCACPSSFPLPLLLPLHRLSFLFSLPHILPRSITFLPPLPSSPSFPFRFQSLAPSSSSLLPPSSFFLPLPPSLLPSSFKLPLASPVMEESLSSLECYEELQLDHHAAHLTRTDCTLISRRQSL